MGSEENVDFDLSAAALRADGTELAVSIETLAASLEQALGGLAVVERHKVGGFRSKQRQVGRIAVSLGEQQLELSRSAQGLRCTRNKVVRGITLSREELGLSDWIAALVAGVSTRAEVSERDRAALEGLLR
jgi:hypothetical protein